MSLTVATVLLAAMLNGHDVALDEQGKIVPWFQPAASAYDEFLRQR